MTTSFAVFLFLLVAVSIKAATTEKLKVVFTMSKEEFGDVIGPALLAPIEKIREELKVDVDWKIIDTKNKPVKVASIFFSTIDNFGPHVIIGEKENDCCEVMTTLASATDTLFISIGCNPMQFVIDRESFPTYASVKTVTFSFGVIVDKVMERFGWKRVALISTPVGVYTVRLRYLKKDLENMKREFFSHTHAKSNSTWEDFNLREKSAKVMLKYLADRATLFVLLMDNAEAKFLLKLAATMGLMNGKHAFLVQGCIEDEGQHHFDIKQCEGVLTADRVKDTETPEWQDFVAKVRSGFDSAEWKKNTDWKRAKDFDSQKPKQKRRMHSAGLLHDGVLLWLNVLKKAKETRPNTPWDPIAKQGTQLSMLSRDMRFEGVNGRVLIKSGSRLTNWTVSMIQNGEPKYILLYEDETGEWTDLNPDNIVWPGAGTTTPKEPRCFVDQCKDKDVLLIIIICCLVAGVFIFLITGFILYVLWKRLQEKKIISNWRIIWTDVTLMTDANYSTNSSADRRSNASSDLSRLHTSAGMYKGRMIAIRAIPRDSVNISEKSMYNELRQMLHVKHDNVNPFIGVCVDAPNVCVAMAYADKGSIQNVLADQQVDIDWEFRMSLALDIAKGMEYLHSTSVGAHGHLTSANCVIDERWVCKITDYGLKLFRCIDKLQRSSLDLLWTAPEILRKKNNDTDRVHGTKPGDVYSFGIIISELLSRELPYQSGMGSVTFEELLAKVMMSLSPPFRPYLPPMEGHIAAEWIALAKNCWQTSSTKRPTFTTIKSILLANHSGKFTNVMERMQMMLEESIERANIDLLVERRKTEAILESILPRPVFEKIASGTEFEPQLSDPVTLCLCDTIGFYKATSALPADVVVDVLKSMYRLYDEIVEKYGALEINTSGGKDSMMLAGGLAVNAKVDAEAICTMSLELLSFIGTFTHPRIETRSLQMKITIHTGSAYTAVMGKQMPQLQVFGEMVQTANDLHTFGNTMIVRITSATRDRLPAIGGFKIQKSEDVTIKDRLVNMYVVTGKDGFTKPLPSPATPSPAKPLPATPSPAPRRKSASVRRRSSVSRTLKE